MQLEVDVSESDVGLIKQDQQVSFTVDAFPDKKFGAVVQQIRNTPTSVQNVVTYKIIASVKNDALLLRPGMTANVSIEVARVDDVLKVPNAALRFKPQTGDENKPEPQRKDKNKMLNRLTKELELNEAQAASLGSIIKAEGAKLQSITKTAESEDIKKKAFRDFMKQVITQLYPLLSTGQSEKMSAWIAQRRKAAAGRTGEKKRATVYVTNEQGKPELVKIWSGISNETETQILTRRLKVDDEVIIGIDFNAKSGKAAGSSNPFMPSRRRR